MSPWEPDGDDCRNDGTDCIFDGFEPAKSLHPSRNQIDEELLLESLLIDDKVATMLVVGHVGRE